MRHLIILMITLVILSNCAPEHPLHIPKERNALGVNFSKFSDKNFLFTPYKYEGKYKSIGIVEFSIKSGLQYEPGDPNWTEGEWVYDYATSDEILDYAYEIATKMGADALCDFKINRTYEDIIHETRAMTLPVVEVSGFAIKRQGGK